MRGGSGRTGARGTHRHRPRADERARTGTGDGRLLPQALQRADRLDHHRDRHRRTERQHHHHRARRQVRPGPAAPAARARRPQPPPGLRLPADTATQTDDRRCAEAPGSHRQCPGPGCRLRAGHPRPGNPRRRRTARRRPERADPGSRLHPVHGNARTCGQVDPQGRAAQSRPTPGRRPGDQPAGTGADPRGLPAGCTRA